LKDILIEDRRHLPVRGALSSAATQSCGSGLNEAKFKLIKKCLQLSEVHFVFSGRLDTVWVWNDLRDNSPHPTPGGIQTKCCPAAYLLRASLAGSLISDSLAELPPVKTTKLVRWIETMKEKIERPCSPLRFFLTLNRAAQNFGASVFSKP
jgi:hypothetical protein